MKRRLRAIRGKANDFVMLKGQSNVATECGLGHIKINFVAKWRSVFLIFILICRTLCFEMKFKLSCHSSTARDMLKLPDDSVSFLKLPLLLLYIKV